jgi:fermentation-respiration switch protein FrsA (DUF1100 family)
LAPFYRVEDVLSHRYTEWVAQKLIQRIHIDIRTLDIVDEAWSVIAPSLVVHGERDTTIPIQSGQRVYDALGSKDKTFLRIPDGGHEDFWSKNQPVYEGLTLRETVRRFFIVHLAAP